MLRIVLMHVHCIEKTDIIESPHWEEMFVEVTDPSNPSKVKLTVGNFYRPPHTNVAQLQSFNRQFAHKLESMNKRDTTLCVAIITLTYFQ